MHDPQHLLFDSSQRILEPAPYSESCEKSLVCRLNLQMRGPFLTPEEADELDNQCKEANTALVRSGKRAHTAKAPCIRVSGPLVNVLVEVDKTSPHHLLGIGHNHF